MAQQGIRPLAICVFRNGDRILVGEGYDSVKRETFYRPIGGGVHFGEHSREGLAREIREELGAEVTDLEFIGAIENIFTCDGQPGHEIVMVYDGKLTDSSLYEREYLDGCEEGGLRFRAVWKSLAEFGDGEPPLYPEGLLEMLRQASGPTGV